MSEREQLNPIASTDATVLRGGGVRESMPLWGIYTFEGYRPKAHDFAEYCELNTEIARLQSLKLYALADQLVIQRDRIPLVKEWEDRVHNTTMDLGVRHMLDNYLNTSAFTQTGPFLGLISNASWSAVNAADTMSSHAGWTEAGTTNAPQWTTPASGARHGCNGGFSAAATRSKALSAAKAFSISTTGTVKGAFMVLGSGAVATCLDTNGTLLSAATFSGGDKAVGNSDTLSVSWSLGL